MSYSDSIYALPGAADYATLGICLTNFAILIVLMSISIYNHNYQPIKAKQPFVVFITVTSLLLGFIAASIMNLNVPRFPILKDTCWLWSIWLENFFGIILVLALINFRLYKLYVVLIRKKEFWKYPSLVILAFIAPGLLMCIAIQATPRSTYYDDDPMYQACFFEFYSQVVCAVMFTLYVLFFIYLAVSLRNIRKSFNEYYHSRLEGFGMMICILTGFILIFFRGFSYIWGRCLFLYLFTLMANLSFSKIAQPLYGCLFRYEECLQEFRVQLSRELDLSSGSKGTKDSKIKNLDSRQSSNLDPNSIIMDLNSTITETQVV